MKEPVKTIDFNELHENFIPLVEEIEKCGINIYILRDNKIIAIVKPGSSVKPISEKSRLAALEEMNHLLDEGLNLGDVSYSRDELHECR